jgi:hypothetical protein
MSVTGLLLLAPNLSLPLFPPQKFSLDNFREVRRFKGLNLSSLR